MAAFVHGCSQRTMGDCWEHSHPHPNVRPMIVAGIGGQDGRGGDHSAGNNAGHGSSGYGFRGMVNGRFWLHSPQHLVGGGVGWMG